ncbi:MAG: phage protein Gp27 family protein [Rhizobium rosettiformans]
MARRGRGWISSIDRLPEPCQPVVAWASQELAKMDRTQIDIYNEFKARLEAVMAEHEIEFTIPHFRSFSRYSVSTAALSTAIEQARRAAETLTQRFDAAGSDDLTCIAAEAIKSLTLEATIKMIGTGDFNSKTAQEFSTALKQLAAAQASSANRRMKLEAEKKLRDAEAEMASKTSDAVKQVAKEKGFSKELTDEILSQILGVKSS